MELELKRDAIHCFETVADVTICQEETQEAIVPDACPDILRIVEVCGQACLTGKQAREGMATVSGMVRASVPVSYTHLYHLRRPPPRGASIPISETARPHPGWDPDGGQRAGL